MRTIKVLIFLLTAHAFAFGQEMDNPYILENEWSGYSIGDPYVIKHRGVFYLFCSTKDSETGVKTWSSRDLVNWTYEGLTSTDPVTKGAYAPEVFYWNGTFYMYTSPAGNGHYVLSAPSPTGPYVPVTPNLGKSIDGTVFADDDGSLYFYHASPGGIIGCPMENPTSIGAGTNTGAFMNNSWTEGACVFKRNNIYYMIYTGNHVISKGYRIDYARSTTDPITNFEPAEIQNPVLVEALGLHTGLGHGSVFIGPDLDSYYLTYHNLVSGIGPFRRLNFDRIAWNHEKMVVLGPTDFAQQNPSLPDAWDYLDRETAGDAWHFSGGDWKMNNGESLMQDAAGTSDTPELALLDSLTTDNFTAEYNFRELERNDPTAALGAVFGYTDDSNYALVMVNSQDQAVEISYVENDTWSEPVIADLPAMLDFSHWHTLRLEQFGDTLSVYVDAMLQYRGAFQARGGKTGYATRRSRGEFSYMAFSNKVNGSGTFDIYKPVPGKIPAIQYNSGGEGTGFHLVTEPVRGDRFMRTDEVDVTGHEHGGVALAGLETGEWFNYNINVELTKLYNINLVYRTHAGDNRVRFYLDEQAATESLELPSTGGEWKTFLVKDVELDAGYRTLRAEVEGGTIDLYSLEFVPANNYGFDDRVPFDGSFGAGWKYYDGEWHVNSEYASIDGFGKRTYGSDAWRDYTVETEIMFTRSMNAGLIFRVNNPALGGAGTDPAAGTDYLQGYFCGFNFGSVVLGRHNYGWKSLTTAPKTLDMNTWYHLRVVMNDDRIRVFVDDMTTPVIDYTDQYPFINGMAGLRAFNTGARFRNFRVTSELLTTGVDDPAVREANAMRIYPNPAAGQMKLSFDSPGPREVRITDLKGSLVHTSMVYAESAVIGLDRLEPGVYIVRAAGDDHALTRRMIVKK